MSFKPLALLFSTSLYCLTSVALPIELDCLVKPEKLLDLSSPVDTVIDRLLVKPGDVVAKGEALVRLESSVERARLYLAKEQANSTSDIENRKVQLRYARANYKRIKQLFDKKSVSQFERDKAETEYQLAKIELEKARDARELAQLRYSLAQSQLALKTLTSPIEGIVVDIFAREGESVADRPVMRLAQVNPLRVELIAPSEYFGVIKEGMLAEIQTELPEDGRFDATVTVVDQIIDAASGSFTVRLSLPNPGDELVGGVNCLAVFGSRQVLSTHLEVE